jgi:hypothetical protein
MIVFVLVINMVNFVSYDCGKVKSWWFKEGWWDGEELVSLNKEKGIPSFNSM